MALVVVMVMIEIDRIQRLSQQLIQQVDVGDFVAVKELLILQVTVLRRFESFSVSPFRFSFKIIFVHRLVN